VARGDQLLRQWTLLKRLQTRGEGAPLRDLADELGVSERTIQRDFESLQELGFPIEHEEDACGKRFWRMPHDFFRTGPLVLSMTEAVSLHLAGRLVTHLGGTHFEEGFSGVLEKIRGILPQKAMDYFAELDETILVRRSGRTDYTGKEAIIRLLEAGARRQESVEIRYRALWRGAEYTTRCDPYGLVLYEEDLFLVGRSHRAEAVRVFKVVRILEAKATENHFERPADFRLDEQFRASFGIWRSSGEPVEVAVRFRGVGAALVEERVWHESQRLIRSEGDASLFDPDPVGSDTLVARFVLADLSEFKVWIRGFGEMAEVLSPAWLRAEMRAEMAAAARRYGENTG
jgi:predicted DNA-binding transcriptional regulator YafY